MHQKAPADCRAAEQHGHAHVGAVGQRHFGGEEGVADLDLGLDHGAGFRRSAGVLHRGACHGAAASQGLPWTLKVTCLALNLDILRMQRRRARAGIDLRRHRPEPELGQPHALAPADEGLGGWRFRHPIDQAALPRRGNRFSLSPISACARLSS